jgi:hypothetical protein
MREWLLAVHVRNGVTLSFVCPAWTGQLKTAEPVLAVSPSTHRPKLKEMKRGLRIARSTEIRHFSGQDTRNETRYRGASSELIERRRCREHRLCAKKNRDQGVIIDLSKGEASRLFRSLSSGRSPWIIRTLAGSPGRITFAVQPHPKCTKLLRCSAKSTSYETVSQKPTALCRRANDSPKCRRHGSLPLPWAMQVGSVRSNALCPTDGAEPRIPNPPSPTWPQRPAVRSRMRSTTPRTEGDRR